jgi:hypothetical protein
VSAIDTIIVLLGSPTSKSNQVCLAKHAQARQQTCEDSQSEQFPALVDPLTSREPSRPGKLEMIFSGLLERPVTLQNYSCTYLDKKDTRYLAVCCAMHHIVDADG